MPSRTPPPAAPNTGEGNNRPVESAPAAPEARKAEVPRLHIDVEWADITKTTADVVVVGHYIGVVPQNAELALDRALSADRRTGAADDSRLILTDLTRRGAIRGSLGDVSYFPWNNKGHIVLAGMGRLGTFKEPQLRILAASVAQSVGRLFPAPHVSTVLIGSGFGNLRVADAVSGLIGGFASALAADTSLSPIALRIVEFQVDRAYEIYAEVQRSAKAASEEAKLGIDVGDDVIEREDTGGGIRIPFGFSMLLASLAQECHDDRSTLSKSVDDFVQKLPESVRDGVKASLRLIGADRNLKRLGLAFRLVPEDEARNGTMADRMSFSHDGARIQGAAITNLTTVSTSTMEVNLGWIDRVVEALRAPAEDVLLDRGQRAFRSLVHQSLRDELLQTDPLVLELDRTMARVPWELVHNNGGEPLAIRRAVARQLRTTYSPRPSDVVLRPVWKALVIGDPDGTLPAARAEAKAVAKVLADNELKVDLRIGPPDVLGLGSEPDIEAADLFEVLELLQSGEYDIVHYAGHAFFTAEFPDSSGWAFKDDVLTASKLETVERPPQLVVANACISAAVSNRFASRVPASTPAATPSSAEGAVVASLADEFFRRGVADYIGTAWEIPELPARQFAESLYTTLFSDWKNGPQQAGPAPTLGAAVLKARQELHRNRASFGDHSSVWAAYQHYGDPTRTLADYR